MTFERISNAGLSPTSSARPMVSARQWCGVSSTDISLGRLRRGTQVWDEPELLGDDDNSDGGDDHGDSVRPAAKPVLRAIGNGAR